MESNDRSVKISAVIMASGHSRRFQGNKLWADVKGKPLVQRTMDNLQNAIFYEVIVVSRDEKICEMATSYGYKAVLNPDTTNDTAVTIRLGINAVSDASDGCAFFVADQPFLKQKSIKGITDQFKKSPEMISMMRFQGHKGNPVIFPRKLFAELAALEPNEQGKAVVKKHTDLILPFEAECLMEVYDIDYREDLEKLIKMAEEEHAI